MFKCLDNDSKLQMRLNIQQHRQKLLKYLENTNDTILLPKIKSVLNNLEKHNVKQKIESSAEFLSPKHETTIEVTNYNTRSDVWVQDSEFVKNITGNNHEFLTDIDIKQLKPRSTVTVNQIQPDVKVKLHDELPLSNFELQLEPIPNNEIKDLESPPVFLKNVKDQLFEQLDYNDDDSCSKEIDDDTISVENNEDQCAIFQNHDEGDVVENDSSNLSLTEAVKYDGHEQSANEKSKKECKYLCFCSSIIKII